MISPSGLLFRMLVKRDPFYVISHERSGTHFAINTLFRNTYVAQHLHYVGDWLGPYEDSAGQFRHLDGFRNDWARIRARGGMIKSHCDTATFRTRFPEAPVVYVIRDARDTLVSFFHYLNKDELYITNPGLASQRCADFSEFLRRPASDYLRLGFFAKPDFDNVAGRWACHVAGWLAMPGVTVVRYENLMTDFKSCVRQVCRGVGLLPRWHQAPVGMGEGAAVLPRKGIIGDWKTHFSAGDEEFLYGELARYGLNPEGVPL